MSTKAVDAAAVLFESVRPLPEPHAGRADVRPPYHGLPGHVVVDPAKLDGRTGAAAAVGGGGDHRGRPRQDLPVGASDERVRRLGISVQPARSTTPTTRPGGTIFPDPGERLLAALPGYKGPDVYRRGAEPRGQAFYFLDELEDRPASGLTGCYHRQAPCRAG